MTYFFKICLSVLVLIKLWVISKANVEARLLFFKGHCTVPRGNHLVWEIISVHLIFFHDGSKKAHGPPAGYHCGI